MPAPPLRFTEGENMSTKFINKTLIPLRIHFHRNHDDKNDGVFSQIMPNESYTYNIAVLQTALLCTAATHTSTSLHIRMGMYDANDNRSKGQAIRAR